jgi:hypothetical protein
VFDSESVVFFSFGRAETEITNARDEFNMIPVLLDQNKFEHSFQAKF